MMMLLVMVDQLWWVVQLHKENSKVNSDTFLHVINTNLEGMVWYCIEIEIDSFLN